MPRNVERLAVFREEGRRIFRILNAPGSAVRNLCNARRDTGREMRLRKEIAAADVERGKGVAATVGRCRANEERDFR